jgi:hypothetical protein
VVTAGGNYGWPHCEGTQPSSCENPGDVAPIFDFPHGDLDGAGSVIGGAFAGAAFDANADAYVFADFNSSRLYLAQPNGTRDGIVGTPTTIVTNADSPVDVIRGPDGAIYYTAISGGEIRRVAAGTLGPQLLVGKKIDLHANPNAVKRRASLMLKDSTIALGGLAGNPTLADSTLRLVGATFDVTYDMPKENWRIIGKPTAVKGYKYKDKHARERPGQDGEDPGRQGDQRERQRRRPRPHRSLERPAAGRGGAERRWCHRPALLRGVRRHGHVPAVEATIPGQGRRRAGGVRPVIAR